MSDQERMMEVVMASPKVWIYSASLSWGEVSLAVTEDGLCCLSLPGEGLTSFDTWVNKKFGQGREGLPEPPAVSLLAALGERVIRQLEEYFAGRRREFELPLDLSAGTPFQQAVWDALQAIPYGQTLSYRELAIAVGRPGGPRAVGQALGANPVPIVVPCHRVIAADGSLGGFGGGLPLKARLLRLEGVTPAIRAASTPISTIARLAPG
ncbi:MAG: methylated-DNA--[protein]-cysteine S-methyltransferase [Firmicutes bacterium]|nr:methylated-DNA--[protein]-cysteine S-methyltransferase [Bacillota bacterium]MCL5039863.1 methylated-DNA--[protein]-cysteine S-methyltransferase [Bacillota bacterium]